VGFAQDGGDRMAEDVFDRYLSEINGACVRLAGMDNG